MTMQRADWAMGGSIGPQYRRLAKSANPDYVVRIYDASMGVDIVADMPEQFNFAVASEFQARAPVTGSEGTAADTILKGFDKSLQFKSLTQQVWVSTSPVEIPLSLIFDAESSAREEVWVPGTLLEAMALPKGSGDLVMAPSSGGSTSVTIGRKLLIPNTIVVSVSSTYDARIAADGYPIAAQVEITLRTHTILSAEDWLTYKGV